MNAKGTLAFVCLVLAVGCSCRAGGDGASVVPGPSEGVGVQHTKQASEGVITVRVTGVRNDRGAVLVSLFETATGFPGDHAKAASYARSPAARGQVLLDLPPLPAGRYSVAALHDENANEKVDTGFMGIPTEGTGVSNNPKPRMGPPTFEDSLFEFSGEPLTLEIPLRYLTAE